MYGRRGSEQDTPLKTGQRANGDFILRQTCQILFYDGTMLHNLGYLHLEFRIRYASHKREYIIP